MHVVTDSLTGASCTQTITCEKPDHEAMKSVASEDFVFSGKCSRLPLPI